MYYITKTKTTTTELMDGFIGFDWISCLNCEEVENNSRHVSEDEDHPDQYIARSVSEPSSRRTELHRQKTSTGPYRSCVALSTSQNL